MPAAGRSSQEQIAELENLLMAEGEEPEPAYYDLLPVHLPIHREAEDQARAAGDFELAARIERHVQASLALMRANVAMLAEQNPPPPIPVDSTEAGPEPQPQPAV